MSEKNKYFLSLGAGHHQKPLIQAARDAGYLTIGVDNNTEAVGLALCDIKIQESILNYRKIHYKLVTYPKALDLAGGFSASYGSALMSWAYLAERLSLPGLSRTLTESLLNKNLVRDRLARAENKPDIFAQPKYLPLNSVVNKADIEQMGFPLILKDKRGTSKQNVYQMESYGELKRFLSKKNLSARNLKGTDILLEEKIEGDEITVVGLIENFQYHLLTVTDKVISSQPPFIELEHKFPSRYHSMFDEIQELHQWFVDTLEVPMGPFVSEFKVHKNRLYLVELSPQIPGEYLGNFLIPAGIKYDFFGNLVRNFTGEPIDKPTPPRKLKSVRVQYWPQKVPIDSWEDWRLKANFARILNENPRVPPESNRDRFGVMGFIE